MFLIGLDVAHLWQFMVGRCQLTLYISMSELLHKLNICKYLQISRYTCKHIHAYMEKLHKLLIWTFHFLHGVCSPLPRHHYLHLDLFSSIYVPINSYCLYALPLCVTFFIGPCGSMLLRYAGNRVIHIESQWHTAKRGWAGMYWSCFYILFYYTICPAEYLLLWFLNFHFLKFLKRC